MVMLNSGIAGSVKASIPAKHSVLRQILNALTIHHDVQFWQHSD